MGALPHAYVLQERRDSERHSADLEAIGTFGDADAAIGCRVIDVSDIGAKIKIGAVDTIPNRLRLFIPNTDTLHECEVVRRDGNELGLRFISRDR